MKKAYNKRTLDGTYGNNSYDDMRSLLNLSRLLKEQEEPETGFETYQEEDVDNTTDEEEQTKEYTVSGGKIVTHGMNAQELELTGDEQGVYQETMDEFVEQVSDMAEFHPLELYKNNVEWSGELLKFDIRFYLVAILFIIFDLEIAFLFPWAISLGQIGLFGFISMMIFLFILTVGFVYEWKKGALDWD